jgi:hypothetical protein
MSANNWRVCPNCQRLKDAEVAKAIERAEAQYGNVPAKRYAFFLEEVEKLKERYLDETLREDYQLGMDHEGQFCITYRCSCQKCGFAFRYQHEEAVNLKEWKGCTDES